LEASSYDRKKYRAEHKTTRREGGARSTGKDEETCRLKPRSIQMSNRTRGATSFSKNAPSESQLGAKHRSSGREGGNSRHGTLKEAGKDELVQMGKRSLRQAGRLYSRVVRKKKRDIVGRNDKATEFQDRRLQRKVGGTGEGVGMYRPHRQNWEEQARDV